MLQCVAVAAMGCGMNENDRMRVVTMSVVDSSPSGCMGEKPPKCATRARHPVRTAPAVTPPPTTQV